MPTKFELEFYTEKMSNGFTENQLVTVLESSKEYKILEKAQTNLVNGTLPGNITDLQIKLDVRTIYESVYGTDKLPSDEEETFLILKYIQYNIDKQKLLNLIQFIKNFDDAELSDVSKEYDIRKTINFLKGNKSKENKKTKPIMQEESIYPIYENVVPKTFVQQEYQQPKKSIIMNR